MARYEDNYYSVTWRRLRNKLFFEGGFTKLKVKKNRHVVPCPFITPHGRVLGQAKLLDTQLPLEELCTPATSNNASVKNQPGVGNRVFSIGTKQHEVNTSYAGNCLEMPAVTWKSHKKVDLRS